MKLFIVFMLPVLGLAIASLVRNFKHQEEETAPAIQGEIAHLWRVMRKNGAITESTTYHVMVDYKTKSGNLHTAEEIVSLQQYNLLQSMSGVPMLVSSDGAVIDWDRVA